jgi:hypothetical protein
MKRKTTTSEDPNALTTATISYPANFSAPQTLTLTVPSANVPGGLKPPSQQDVLDPAKVEDVLLVITYSIG